MYCDLAERAIKFISKLKCPDGEFAGKPFVLLQWQREWIRQLLRTADGKRLIRKSYLWIPKKNGKTTLLAALATFFLFTEKSGSIFCGANDKEQASILYRMVKAIIEYDPWLSSQCRIYKGNVRKIVCRYSNSDLTVGSSEAFTKNGLNISVAIFDEIGFFESSELMDAIESSMIGRSNPIILGISTAGSDAQSFGGKLFDYTRKAIAAPAEYPAFLGTIFEGHPDKWDSVAEWLACNPSLKELGNLDFVRQQIDAAKKDPSQLRRILRYHLNVWAGDDSEGWIDPAKISIEKIDLELLKGKDCYIGIDLASRSDMSCVCCLFPLAESRYAALFQYFTPADTLAAREYQDKAPYASWVRAKLLTAVPGDFMDSSPVFEYVKALRGKYNIKKIGLDQAHNSADLTSNLQREFGQSNVSWVSQGWKVVVPTTKEIETLIASSRLVTSDNPIFKWNVGNVRCKVADDAGNLMPSKKKSTARIDGVFALIDALSLEMLDRNRGRPSIN